MNAPATQWSKAKGQANNQINQTPEFGLRLGWRTGKGKTEWTGRLVEVGVGVGVLRMGRDGGGRRYVQYSAM